jgi:4-methyl-5(b-hydroxyethyl)-thiazole monophosphate biosynthesis
MPGVLIPLAEGFEELEAVTVIDLLRRAQLEVDVAGLEAGPVRGSRGTVIVPDITVNEAIGRDYDMVVLPGGLPGATNLDGDPRVHELLKRAADAGKFTAAICAAPKVLAHAGLLEGRRATSFPGTLEEAGGGAQLEHTAVVRDGTVITSRGPGTAMDFALELVHILAGAEVRNKVEAALQRPKEHISAIA